MKTDPAMLAPDERKFVELSLRENRRHRFKLIRRGALAAAAVVIAIFVATLGLRQVSYGFSYVSTLPKVWNDKGRAPPLSQSARANLRASIDALTTALNKTVGEVGRRPELNPWGVAQIWTALHGLHPSLGESGPGTARIHGRRCAIQDAAAGARRKTSFPTRWSRPGRSIRSPVMIRRPLRKRSHPS